MAIFCIDKKLAMLKQFCQYRKMIRQVIYTIDCLKNENYILELFKNNRFIFFIGKVRNKFVI